MKLRANLGGTYKYLHIRLRVKPAVSKWYDNKRVFGKAHFENPFPHTIPLKLMFRLILIELP